MINHNLDKLKLDVAYWLNHQKDLTLACQHLCLDEKYSLDESVQLVLFWNLFFTRILSDAENDSSLFEIDSVHNDYL